VALGTDNPYPKFWTLYIIFHKLLGPPHRGHDCMEVGFTTTYAISSYHHQSCEFEPWSWWGVLDTTLCDKVCQWLAAGLWFSPGTPVSSTNKTDCHDITEILLKVALHTINHNHKLLNQAAKVIQTDLCCSSCISEAASNGEISVGISPRPCNTEDRSSETSSHLSSNSCCEKLGSGSGAVNNKCYILWNTSNTSTMLPPLTCIKASLSAMEKWPLLM
jgi:hypothetical protein